MKSRNRNKLKQSFGIGGHIRMRIYDLYGKCIHDEWMKNGIPDAAINHVLGVQLGAVAQVTTWYMGLIDNAGFVSLSASDTSASHAGWAESAAYSELVRQTLTFGVASGKTISTTASAVFTMSAPTNIVGGFLSSSNVKGGAGGILWATALGEGGVHSLVGGQLMKFDYSMSGTSS